MTHAQYDGTGLAAASGRRHPPFRRVLAGMVRVRERHAARAVAAHLHALDDASLALVGLDRQALHRELAAGGPV